MNVNQLFLGGNLTRDPELSYLPSNTAVVNIGIAVNRKWKNQDGKEGEDTLFIDCACFGRRAEVINQYFKKGDSIFVQGRLQLDQWTDREGNKRSKHKVFILDFQFVGGKKGGGGGRRDDDRQDDRGGGGGGGRRHDPPSQQDDGPPDYDDDIPF